MGVPFVVMAIEVKVPTLPAESTVVIDDDEHDALLHLATFRSSFVRSR